MATFSIRSSTIRFGIFASTLVIATILIFQLVWLKKVYLKEQKEFDQGVIKSIRGLYGDLNSNAYYTSSLNELIENPEPHLYIAHINLPVNPDTLVGYLHSELEDFGIFTSCHLGIFSADSDRYIFTDILESAVSKDQSDPAIPVFTRNYDHLTLYFPKRRQYIIGQMNFWIISSALLLLVLILFGGSLYYFYRQKFLNETQKDLIHNFTHEFKTPVSVIGLAADVLKNPSTRDKPEKLATYAGIVEYQAAYLQNQIEKLLRFAYTESGQLHLSRERVNIDKLVQEAVNNLAPQINERSARLIYEEHAEEPWLEADRDYLVIVITNLIDNAIKYSKNPCISIKTKNSPNRMILSVTDNGIGIEKKQIKNLFRKFFRVRKEETHVAKGFGLGLSFVKKIVSAHNGKIRVDSEPGKGSIFTIELPIQ